MKLSLMMIVRDEGETLRACLESVAPYVDEIVIGLGGKSSDDTEAIAREFVGGSTGTVFEIPWEDDFAKARNKVLKRVRGDAALWLDGDDLLVGGDKLRAHAERLEDANCIYVGYDYGKGEFGETVCFLIRERLVRGPKLWTWVGRIHEVLTLDPDVPLATFYAEDVMVVHQPNGKQKGNRNLDLLYRELKESEPEPAQRTLMYLGNENASRGKLDEALLHWNRFIARSKWNEESYQVAHKIADVLRSQGKLDEAYLADQRAIRIMPSWPDAYFGLAETAYASGEWQGVIEWTKAGATKPPPVTGLITNPTDYSYAPYYILGLAYAQLGDTSEAVQNLHRAAEVRPDEQIMRTILALDAELDARKVLDAFMTLYGHLGRHDEWLKARKLFEVAPKLIETHPDVREAWWKTSQSTAHVVDPQVMVDFYRGNPDWQPMPEEYLLSEEWSKHPRLEFARKSLCGPPKWVLDMGSSDGFISLPLAKEGYKVMGYDLDPRCVELANKRGLNWDVPAHYAVGSVEDINLAAKYDAALAFEIIEHLVDPGAFLDKLGQHANKIILTTPYLAWEGGRLTDDKWQKVEPKGHLRIFDLPDMESLLGARGRIVDLYREPYGSTGWIFASYYPSQYASKTITFLAPGTLEEWSPRKLATEGLGGSEIALIKLAEEFGKTGWLPTTFGRIDHPGYYNGVRYRQAEHFLPDVGQDCFIAWRYPEAADLPIPSDNLILWMHDTDAGDRLTPARAGRFRKIVVLSEWHAEYMLKVYPWLSRGKLVVIGNGVDAKRFTGGRVKREKMRVAYTSSPDRGLDVVLEHIWPKVTEAVPDAELHVYYGWNNFEALKTAYPSLAEFQRRIADLTLSNRNVINHGRVPQDKLAEELRKASIWLYPTYFSETYCISAVEAQLAGAVPVTNDLAALSETVKSGFRVKGDVRDPEVAQKYADYVIGGLNTGNAEMHRSVIKRAPRLSWEDAAEQWREVIYTD